MSENISGYEDKGLDRAPLAPVVRGLEFLEDHHIPWLTGDHEIVTSEALATLRGLADRVVIIDDLSEYATVDPDLRDSIHPYSPMRSETSLPSLGGLLDQLHSAYGQPDNPSPT